jgi:glycosyltransferase involved in cell wall biosynthesis
MAWYARLRGVPVLMFPRGGGIIDASRVSALTRCWVRLAFGGATMLLCQSAKWHDFACRVLDFPASRAPVIPNWTATPDLLAIGHSRGLREGGPVRLLFLGWLDREKGVGELLDACHRLRAQRNFTLDIAGEGNFSGAARALVERHRIADVVRFRGWLQGDALRAALAESDVLVLPSWAEGLPNAMVEAMAARLAIVVTSVGSIPDVVTDGRDALLVPPRDVLALERALSRVIDDRDLRQRLGEAALALAEVQFGVEPAIDRIIAALGQAIGETRGPSSSNSLSDDESPSGR